jgi:hypothetical protein
MKYLKLKDILLEIQQESETNPEILNEMEQTFSSNKYKIRLSEIAEEIVNEYNEYRVKDIKDNLIWGELGGSWNKQKYESIGDYEERVNKAEFRLERLLEIIKEDIKNVWENMQSIPSVNKLDNESKKQIVEILLNDLKKIAEEMLRTLSTYPFKW